MGVFKITNIVCTNCGHKFSVWEDESMIICDWCGTILYDEEEDEEDCYDEDGLDDAFYDDTIYIPYYLLNKVEKNEGGKYVQKKS